MKQRPCRMSEGSNADAAFGENHNGPSPVPVPFPEQDEPRRYETTIRGASCKYMSRCCGKSNPWDNIRGFVLFCIYLSSTTAVNQLVRRLPPPPLTPCLTEDHRFLFRCLPTSDPAPHRLTSSLGRRAHALGTGSSVSPPGSLTISFTVDVIRCPPRPLPSTRPARRAQLERSD